MSPIFKVFSIFILLVALLGGLASAQTSEPVWTRYTQEEGDKIRLYFFWSQTCPHCRKAKPFVEKLAQTYDWLEVQSHEISENPENAKLFWNLTEQIGEKVTGVPAFLYCGKMHVGFRDEWTTGKTLRDQLLQCRGTIIAEAKDQVTKSLEDETLVVNVPFMGKFDPSKLSLPIYTIVIAGLDAFNPCAFFVLLMLLSLLVHAKNRQKMLLIGGIFVFFSGFIYFIFMAAWLNVFLFLGEMRIITAIAAGIAILMAVINIKDYFAFQKNVSLCIPFTAKQNLYQRMRGLIFASSFPVLIFGTIALAIAANFYELLCTAGFPMVFTRVLTLHDLPAAGYYLYLLFYNLIYVIPLSVIVLAFVITLGSRKLSENEGRILKLTSGLMMLGLGLILLISPNQLSNIYTAMSLLGGSVLLSFVIYYWDQKIGFPRLPSK